MHVLSSDQIFQESLSKSHGAEDDQYLGICAIRPVEDAITNYSRLVFARVDLRIPASDTGAIQMLLITAKGAASLKSPF